MPGTEFVVLLRVEDVSSEEDFDSFDSKASSQLLAMLLPSILVWSPI